MDAALLDTLVKLASLGTSGICIFAIFWVGFIIYRKKSDALQQGYKSLRNFMIMTLSIALISLFTSYLNVKFDEDEINRLTQISDSLKIEISKYKIPYKVKGSLTKDDDESPIDILISASYPPLYPSSEGNICGLKVFRKGPSEEFPILAFSHPDYATEPIDLNDSNSVKITNKELKIKNTIKLFRIPEE